MTVKHAFTNPNADGADTTITRPSDWNADHVGLPEAAVPSGKYLKDNGTWDAPASGSGNFGVATIPFTAWLNEDTIAVIGQSSLTANSRILCSIYADNDDVYAQGWQNLIIHNLIVGTGFNITIRTDVGTFKGGVKINWSWGN